MQFTEPQVPALEGCDTSQTSKDVIQNGVDEIKKFNQIVIPQAIKFIDVHAAGSAIIVHTFRIF